MKRLVDRDTAFRAVFTDVAREVAQRSSGAQKPALLGQLDDFPLWGATRRSSVFNPSRLALFFLQQAPVPPPPQDVSDLESAIARVSGFIGRDRWAEAAASIRDARASLSPAQWTVLRDRGIVATADVGQEIVARYGSSDLLPGDPEKLVETDFIRAGRAFETALTILGLAPLAPDQERIYAPYRAFLTARLLFAEGRTAAFHPDRLTAARDLLVRASAAMSPPIPEISNALGITYLENPSTTTVQRTRTSARRSATFRIRRRFADLVLPAAQPRTRVSRVGRFSCRRARLRRRRSSLARPTLSIFQSRARSAASQPTQGCAPILRAGAQPFRPD